MEIEMWMLDDDFDDDEIEEECGLMADGMCMLAGTEHCDWDCGRLNAQRISAVKCHRALSERTPDERQHD